MFTAFCACDCSDPRHHYCTAWLPIAYYLLFRTSVGGQWTHAAVKNKLFSFILLVTVSSCRGIVGGTDASQLIVCLFAAVTATGSSANSMRGAFTEGNVCGVCGSCWKCYLRFFERWFTETFAFVLSAFFFLWITETFSVTSCRGWEKSSFNLVSSVLVGSTFNMAVITDF